MTKRPYKSRAPQTLQRPGRSVLRSDSGASLTTRASLFKHPTDEPQCDPVEQFLVGGSTAAFSIAYTVISKIADHEPDDARRDTYRQAVGALRQHEADFRAKRKLLPNDVDYLPGCERREAEALSNDILDAEIGARDEGMEREDHPVYQKLVRRARDRGWEWR